MSSGKWHSIWHSALLEYCYNVVPSHIHFLASVFVKPCASTSNHCHKRRARGEINFGRIQWHYHWHSSKRPSISKNTLCTATYWIPPLASSNQILFGRQPRLRCHRVPSFMSPIRVQGSYGTFAGCPRIPNLHRRSEQHFWSVSSRDIRRLLVLGRLDPRWHRGFWSTSDHVHHRGGFLTGGINIPAQLPHHWVERTQVLIAVTINSVPDCY